MGLLQVLVLSLCALLLGWLAPRRWLAALALVVSLAVIFWLQPSTPVRNLDFWLPVAALALTAFAWSVIYSAGADAPNLKSATGLLPALALVLMIALPRYLGNLCCLTASRPPALGPVLTALALTAGLALLPWLLRGVPGAGRSLSWVALLALLAIFIVLKTPALSIAAGRGLRLAAGQSPALAGPLDVVWLGYSFLAFRLIHVLRDFQTQTAGTRPVSFTRFAAYALFFPTYVAGPIDRLPRWNSDLEAGCAPGDGHVPATARLADTLAGGERILIGLFKKFALADSLALFALNAENAAQTQSAGWMWVLLLGYTLRIYLDFSGYSDVAIGIGRLIGFHLPENFNAPYLKTNLTAFWNSWHITLALWFRAYVFNPLLRSLRSNPQNLSTGWMVLIGQVSTMGLIGLWHGVTWNFLIWGLWHGLGLFAHNRWSDWIRPRLADRSGPAAGWLPLAGWALTFLYVSLGWVWFALPDVGLALHVLATLLGIV